MDYHRYVLKNAPKGRGLWRPIEIPINVPRTCPFCSSENVVGRRKITNGGRGYTHYMYVWTCNDHLHSSAGQFRISLDPLPQGIIIETENSEWGQKFQELNPCTEITGDSRPLQKMEKQTQIMAMVIFLFILADVFYILYDGLTQHNMDRVGVNLLVFIILVGVMVTTLIMFVQKTEREKRRLYFGDTQVDASKNPKI